MKALEYLRAAKTLASAYIVFGNSDTFEHIRSFAYERAGGKGSPDVVSFVYNSLGVDEARALSQFASLKSLGEKKYILSTFNSCTPEAQNALLKAVEEGVGNSVFFFSVKTGTVLLPTLLSRCVTLQGEIQEEQVKSRGEQFLSMGYAKRMELVEQLGKGGDKGEACALVAELLSCMSTAKKDAKKLRDVIEADRYLKLSGSSIKSILGHLALTL